MDYLGIDRTELDWVSFANDQLDRLDAIITVLQQYADTHVKNVTTLTDEDRSHMLNLG